MQTTKQELRSEMRRLLRELPPEERLLCSRKLVERLVQSEIWQQAQSVGLFASRADEPELASLWETGLLDGKTVYYPKVEADGIGWMGFYQVRDRAELRPGAFGLLEPPVSQMGVPDLVLVPGLAFDRAGGRLGRGGGYYDRWLAAHPSPGTRTAGVCFARQLLDSVPVEIHDVRLDFVVTDAEWASRSAGCA